MEFNGIRSKSYQVKCEPPKGSIQGPLLYVRNVSKVVNFILFDDDTNIFFPTKISITFWNLKFWNVKIDIVVSS